MRHLVFVLGDQLDEQSAIFDEFDPKQDRLWMAEVEEEATHVWCHKLRIAYFFSAMRHFRDSQRNQGREVLYHQLSPNRNEDRGSDFASILRQDVKKHAPEKLLLVQPGDYRVQQQLQTVADELEIELTVLPDRHFYSSPQEFIDWAKGRKSLLLETFYRAMRKKHDILITEDGKPEGGDWNFDKENRETFSKQGPGELPQLPTFKPDAISREVMQLVEQRYPDHPGELSHFQLPVTSDQAQQMLQGFIENLLPNFGPYEDAMWTDEAFLYHSRLSVLLNLKLLNPRDCIQRAIAAYQAGSAPLNSVEGFVRQILGWREFVRGLYWKYMPEYAEMNFFEYEHDVPSFFWDGDTQMECLRQSMQHVRQHGYAHHIHRLMVFGNFAQLLGVHPGKFHQWHMAMYLDAVDWVSLPNALGMSQYGDGGIMATKPYCASGNYINRMSNFCKHCPYHPKKAVGEDACPITTLYWDFLDRHAERLDNNSRMKLQLKNLDRKRDNGEIEAIRDRAQELIREYTQTK